MSSRVLKSQYIKSIQHGTKAVTIAYATETAAWKRTQLAQEVQQDFAAIVEDKKAMIPAGASKVIMA